MVCVSRFPQILLRGSALRKTAWAIGAVIYTGAETKVTPWAIDYRSYQNPDRNAFFRDDPGLTS